MANVIPPMLIELQLETAKIQAQMQQLNGKFDDFGKTVEKQGGFLQKFKATAAGVFAGNVMATGLNMIRTAMVDAIKDAQEYEVLLSKTAAVIESTGNAAGISVDGLKKQAAALEQLSSVDENIILNGENVIATFTQIRNAAGKGNDIFNQTTKAALDLSVALSSDMQSASIQLGKALNDPIKGVTALTKVGVTFDAQQKAQIKTMVNAGNVLGAQKIILAEVNREFGGAAKAAGDTFAGGVARAKDKVQDFARDLITNVQPVLLTIGKTIGDLYNKFLAPFFSLLARNKETIGAFAAIILTAVVAIKAYNAILAISKAVQTAYAVAQVLMSGGQLASIASTNGLAASMLKLNWTLRENPIGVVVAAIALLAAGFVLAWNKSETFRKVMIEIGKAGLTALSYLIEFMGLYATSVLKVVTGPMRLLLKGLEMLGVKGAGTALKEINGAIDNVGKFFDTAAKKVESYKKTLDGLADKKIKLPSFGGTTPDATTGKTGTATNPTTVTADQLKAAAAAAKAAKAAADKAAKEHIADVKKANDDVSKLYVDMNKVILEGSQKQADELVKRDKKIVDTKQKYADLELKITKKKNDELKKNEDDWNADYSKAYAANKKTLENIEKAYAKKKTDIIDAYNERVADLNTKASEDIADLEVKTQAKITELKEKANDKRIDLEEKYQSKIIDLQAKAEQKSNDLIQKASEKRESIVKQSMDRLRSAFASKTGFDLSKAFETTGSTEGLLEDLKAKLQGAKDLQKNAAALAGMGYSQTFIEEVVKNGPEAGNAIAEALKAASPEATASLQSLYAEVNTLSAHGLDQLAATMNTGANLATEELRTAYAQVEIDLQASLTTVGVELAATLQTLKSEHASAMAEISDTLAKDTAKILTEQTISLAEINKTLAKGLDDAKASQDKALAEAAEARNAAIVDAKEVLDAALAAADEALAAANKKTMDDFNEAIAQNATDLATALEDIQIAYAETIQAIIDDTTSQLDQLNASLVEAANALAALGEAKAAAAAIAYSPGASYVAPDNYTLADAVKKTGAKDAAEYLRESGGKNVTINTVVNNTDTTSPTDIGDTIVRIAKFGLVVD